MQPSIDKNSRETLLTQLCRKLVSDISDGTLRPGMRLPGDRLLAKKYNISRGTVIEALSILEEQFYIERIPSRGSFVANDALKRISSVRIAFAFPENSLSEASLGHLENWTSVSDVYRGLVSKASDLNAEITFIHFEEANDTIALSQQLKKLESFDAFVFVGHQLLALRKAIIRSGNPCVLINHYPELDAGCPLVIPDVDKGFDELFNYIASRGYSGIRILTPKLNHRENMTELKLKKLQHHASENHLAFGPDDIIEVNENKPGEMKKILNPASFKKNKNAVFFNHTDYAVPFYEFCLEHGLEIGKRVGAFGYATGITFQGLVPPLTYSRINHFEIGEAACEMLSGKTRNIADAPVLTKIANTLITGNSI